MAEPAAAPGEAGKAGQAGEEQDLAAARSVVYRIFAELFEYPNDALAAAIASGEPVARLREALACVDPALVVGVDWEALGNAAGSGEPDDNLAVQYTRLFDVGVPGPPCPLYGGLYASERMKTMEEALRFYRHFALATSPSQKELPDHLTVELEFLHFLTFKEVECLAGAGDPGPFRRAQRDFIARHPGRWVPELCERLNKHDSSAFFRELAAALRAFLVHDAAAID